VSRPTPRRLKAFACLTLGLDDFFKRPGDGRKQPQIAARTLLWAQLIGIILRDSAFHAIEAMVRSTARSALGVGCRFGDDSLAYFTERLDPAPTRQAAAQVLRRAKRNKAFENSRFIGLALDGTGAGRCTRSGCPLCHPVLDTKGNVVSHLHHFSAIAIVGTGLTLPFDVEPYGPKDSEYAASQRLLARAVESLGRRFADYVVGDGEYATAPFLHATGDLGLRIVARLKGNLPTLRLAAQERFAPLPPTATFEDGRDRVEIWDADDFEPWEALRWKSVRVIRYRQHKPDGTIVEAYWLTDFSSRRVGSRALYAMCKSRWEIENEVFNDGKNRHGMEHISHHHTNSLLIGWLLVCLALMIERLYRLRYLHRGRHPRLAPIDLLRLLRLSLAAPKARNTS
jgi:hypothetical protein